MGRVIRPVAEISVTPPSLPLAVPSELQLILSQLHEVSGGTRVYGGERSPEVDVYLYSWGKAIIYIGTLPWDNLSAHCEDVFNLHY